jgi:DNA-binding NtrC family response regulator
MSAAIERQTWQVTPVPLPPVDCPIIAVSPEIRRAIGLALRFAPTDLPILLVGPTGSGKEMFARYIHEWSGRRGALVDVNAGALPREMVESLLFGHQRGAFTGAHADTPGLIAAADGGTLFLDELASLPLEGQAKLLRALESGEIRPLGATRNRPLCCRFVAAVQDDIDRRVRDGEFRLDLYQRLTGLVIRLPALIERTEDILPLARGFARGTGRRLSTGAEGVLLEYPWPGNVRELKAAILRAGFLAPDGDEVGAPTMRDAIALGAPVEPPKVSTRGSSWSVEALTTLCAANDWDIGRAARITGIGRATLYRRLRSAGIDPGRWRENRPSETRRDETT